MFLFVLNPTGVDLEMVKKWLDFKADLRQTRRKNIFKVKADKHWEKYMKAVYPILSSESGTFWTKLYAGILQTREGERSMREKILRDQFSFRI